MVVSQGEEFGVAPYLHVVVGCGWGLWIWFRVWFRVDGGVSRSELKVYLAHLAQGEGVVEGRDVDVAAVEDGQGRRVRI